MTTESESKGGKPSTATPKDRRLSENRGKPAKAPAKPAKAPAKPAPKKPFPGAAAPFKPKPKKG